MTELIKTDTKLGEGAEATAGKLVLVHYTGWLYDEAAPDHQGAKFDSPRPRTGPADFPLGAPHQTVQRDRRCASGCSHASRECQVASNPACRECRYSGAWCRLRPTG